MGKREGGERWTGEIEERPSSLTSAALTFEPMTFPRCGRGGDGDGDDECSSDDEYDDEYDDGSIDAQAPMVSSSPDDSCDDGSIAARNDDVVLATNPTSVVVRDDDDHNIDGDDDDDDDGNTAAIVAIIATTTATNIIASSLDLGDAAPLHSFMRGGCFDVIVFILVTPLSGIDHNSLIYFCVRF